MLLFAKVACAMYVASIPVAICYLTVSESRAARKIRKLLHC